MSKTNPEPWPSTKALSVYNVLRFRETQSLSLPEVLAYLREHWDPDYPEAWVRDGAEWLQSRGFASLTNDSVTAVLLAGSNRPARLVRADNDASLRLQGPTP